MCKFCFWRERFFVDEVYNEVSVFIVILEWGSEFGKIFWCSSICVVYGVFVFGICVWDGFFKVVVSVFVVVIVGGFFYIFVCFGCW